MCTRSATIALVAAMLAIALTAVTAQEPGQATLQAGLGAPASSSEIAAWDISILPDGTGLPPGSGTPAQGSQVYAQKCAACHGENGKGAANAALVGGLPLTHGIDTVKTIANFWPHATTLFDFIRRAMPWQRPRTLSDDEVYAVTAYILALNKLIGENDVMNATSLPTVKMPNRDGFIVRFPERMP
jgi:cytochrome c